MSIKVMSEVWEYAPCAENELLVLLAIADMSNDERDCWPSEKRLQWKARCSWRELEAVLESLQLQGILAIESRERKDGGKASNLYHITEVNAWELLTMENTPPSTNSPLNPVDTPQPKDTQTGLSPSTNSPLNPVDESSVLNPQSKPSPTRKRDAYPKRLSEWKQKDMDKYYQEHGTDLDVLVMAWGYNNRFKDQTLTIRRWFVQCYTELNGISFSVENYVSLASFTRAKLHWRGAGLKPTEMLGMVEDWRNTRLGDKPKPEKAAEPQFHYGIDMTWDGKS